MTVFYHSLAAEILDAVLIKLHELDTTCKFEYDSGSYNVVHVVNHNVMIRCYCGTHCVLIQFDIGANKCGHLFVDYYDSQMIDIICDTYFKYLAEKQLHVQPQ